MTVRERLEDHIRQLRSEDAFWQAKRKALSRPVIPRDSDETGPEGSAISAPGPADPSSPDSNGAPRDDKDAAFGTLVHALLALPEFPEGDALARTAAALAQHRDLDEKDAAEARSRYGDQLRRYRTALAALTGQPVKASLCLVRTGELVPVEDSRAI